MAYGGSLSCGGGGMLVGNVQQNSLGPLVLMAGAITAPWEVRWTKQCPTLPGIGVDRIISRIITAEEQRPHHHLRTMVPSPSLPGRPATWWTMSLHGPDREHGEICQRPSHFLGLLEHSGHPPATTRQQGRQYPVSVTQGYTSASCPSQLSNCTRPNFELIFTGLSVYHSDPVLVPAHVLLELGLQTSTTSSTRERFPLISATPMVDWYPV